jgi:GDP-mannose pyrophosphatase NudK
MLVVGTHVDFILPIRDLSSRLDIEGANSGPRPASVPNRVLLESACGSRHAPASIEKDSVAISASPIEVNVSNNNRVRIKNVELLSNSWHVLKKTTFDYLRNDGSWQTQSRETYDRGNGAVILLFNRSMRTVVLTRQFRFPAYVNGLADGMLIEACAGLLELDDAETCIRKEAEEETGFRVESVRKIFEAYMSPGSVTERLFFFVAEYSAATRVSEGGGDIREGEDIEVLEILLDDALHMIETGEVADGKTIMLLQYAKLARLLD